MTSIPRELIVLLVSAIPIGELRVGLPLGVFLGLPILASFVWAVIGNILPMFFILAFLNPVSKFLMKHSKPINKLLTKIFERTRTRHSKKMETIGAISLITFVAIPLPGTGAWTGALICYLFNIPYWKSILYLSLGVIGAAIIMSLGVISVNEIPNFVRVFIK